MPSASEVARHLAYLGHTAEEPDPLTPSRVQKLLYYVQGWSLALRGEPIFPDRIEAWMNGPVVPAVFDEYRGRGSRPIDFPSEPFDSELSGDDQAFVYEVWDEYKAYSVSRLREMARAETPWRDARAGYAPADVCHEEITPDALREFFAVLAAA